MLLRVNVFLHVKRDDFHSKTEGLHPTTIVINSEHIVDIQPVFATNINGVIFEKIDKRYVPKYHGFEISLSGGKKIVSYGPFDEFLDSVFNQLKGVGTLGVAAYSNDSDSPKANFSSKKAFDRCDREIMAGNFVRVDGKVIVQVTEDDTGDLVFSPYDKEELVKAYWMNSLEIVYPIGTDGLCCCNCASRCPLGKVGSMNRCTSSELNGSGIIVVKESEIKK